MSTTTRAIQGHVDVRGTRFAGALTGLGALAAASLALADVRLALPWTALLALLLLAGAFGGPRYNLWGRLYRRLVAPRLAPPSVHQLEPPQPPRFANLIGGVFLAAATASFALGLLIAGVVLAAIVAALAALNATTGYCVGCRFYGLLVLRQRKPEVTQ